MNIHHLRMPTTLGLVASWPPTQEPSVDEHRIHPRTRRIGAALPSLAHRLELRRLSASTPRTGPVPARRRPRARGSCTVPSLAPMVASPTRRGTSPRGRAPPASIRSASSPKPGAFAPRVRGDGGTTRGRTGPCARPPPPPPSIAAWLPGRIWSASPTGGARGRLIRTPYAWCRTSRSCAEIRPRGEAAMQVRRCAGGLPRMDR